MSAVRRLAALAALAVLGSCAGLQNLAGDMVKRPTLTYLSWSAQDLDLDGVTILLKYRVDNPNSFGLDLAKVGYRLDVEGQQVAAGDLPGGLQLKASGASPLDVPVRLQWKTVPRLVELLATRTDLGYRVAGDVGVGTPVGTLTLPFEHAARVPLPRPPSIQLDGIGLRDLGLSAFTLDLRLRLANGNAFPLPAGAFDYGLTVGGARLVSGAAHALAPVPARGQAVVSIPVHVSMAEAAQAASKLLGGAPVHLSGVAGFGALKVPVEAGAAAHR